MQAAAPGACGLADERFSAMVNRHSFDALLQLFKPLHRPHLTYHVANWIKELAQIIADNTRTFKEYLLL